MIELKNLRKSFGSVTPVKNVSVTINDGDVISIIGPSGTGKSSFLRCINMLDPPTSGSVIVDGVDITQKGVDLNKFRQKMGMVFQSYSLFPHLTIIENIMTPQIKLLKRSKQEAYDKAIKLLEQVGLVNKIFSYPDELSGGQKQRIAIARALAMDTEVILFDEPTSALDPTMVGEVLTVIKSLAKNGVTMLIVTHDMNFARLVSNRVFYMDEGTIYEDGSPSQIFDNPLREKTRYFVQKIRSFDWYQAENGLQLISLISDFESFASKNLISPSLSRKAQLFMEEFINQVLRVEKQIVKDVHVQVEYNERTTELVMKLIWEGDDFSPLKDGDEYSQILMSHICPNLAEEKLENKKMIFGTIK